MVQEYLKGTSYPKLSKEYHVTKSTLVGWVKKYSEECQFTSWDFIHYCESKGICQSMSKAGCPYDNAPMERFYNTLKNELIYPNHFYDAASLDEALNHYVYVWYNHVRPHSYNDWKTPFEARYAG